MACEQKATKQSQKQENKCGEKLKWTTARKGTVQGIIIMEFKFVSGKTP